MKNEFSKYLHEWVGTHFIRAGRTIYKVEATKKFTESSRPVFELTSIYRILVDCKTTDLTQMRKAKAIELDLATTTAEKKWLINALIHEIRTRSLNNYLARKEYMEASTDYFKSHAAMKAERRTSERREDEEYFK